MEKMQHFSIRKFSIGAASVLIGISFLGVKASTVKADSLQNSSETELTKSKVANEAIKQDLDSNIKQEAASKTDAKQITSDQPNNAQVPAKSATPKPNSNQQNTVVIETKPQVPVKAKLQTNSAITPEEVDHTEVEATTLMATANKKLNAQMLSESKVVSQDNTTNGGFDEATWGKLDVNDWQGSVQGDYYQLTDYTGDANHVIVPNEADFAKAGISTSGKQVGVTSSLMHAIFKDKATTQDATVAFSKTDNKMIKAIDNDWHDTWAHVSYHGVKAELSKFNGTNLDVSNVTNMNSMFRGNQISDLGSLTDWKVDHVTDMGLMFAENQISDLDPLANWKVDHVTNMGGMFMSNQISDISPLANWSVSQVPRTRMLLMFDDNSSSIQTNTVQAKRIINFIYPAGYTGKKQDSITQIVDVPQKVNVALATKAPKPSDNILDWATKTEKPEAPDPVYFQDYTVPEIKGLLEPDKTVISREQADTTKPINVTVTYKLVESNTNDAFALDPKNGLHEHANVNDNGGYDEDYWGKLNINDWNYTTSGNTITITGYKGEHPTSLIIPNGADFGFINSQNNGDSRVEISSDVMHDLAKNATRIGLSKTANNKVVASDAIWQNAFGGQTNEPGTTSNANGGIKYGSPNLTQMDLHNLDTSAITNMSALFNDGSNLTTVGDLSDWNTSNATNMRIMFQEASSLTNIGNLDNWDTSNVTDMTGMFSNARSLTNIGDLSKWQTGNVTDMALMFVNATSLTDIGNLDNWDTSKVTDMNWMFGTDSGKQSHLTNIGDLSKWQTANVTDMNNMFTNATYLTNIGDLSKWQTGNVTDMALMFANATSLTDIGNLDNWNTSKVTDMNWMFGTDSGKQSHLTNIGDLSKWQTANVTDMSYMFVNARSLTSLDVSNWNTSKVTNMRGMFYNATNLTNIGNLDNWNTSKVTDMSWMFGGATNLTNIGDLSKWQTGNVTNMHSMFDTATSLTNIGNLDNWNTNKVTDMGWMFGTESGKQSHLVNIGNLSKWQTDNVTNMRWMFANATNLANIGDLSKWQTGNVTDMSYMFANATSLTDIGNLDNWNTSKVTDMNFMFGTDSDKQSHLTNIGDLSKWQTANVTDMSYMFASAKSLRHLNVSNWNLTKLTDKDKMKYMFANDANLTIIANNLKLPAWYQNEINDADYFWNNHMAVITNVPELIRATGDINNLKIDEQNTSRSIFYDSKGSSDAIQVLKDVNQAYINKYEQNHPKYLLALDASVDQTDPIALANAIFKTSHKLIDVVQTDNSTRTIIVHLPNGTIQTMVQTIGLKRNAQKDLVTETINSTASWELDEANSSYTINGVKQTQTAYKQNSNAIVFSSIKLPNIPGYKAVAKTVASPVNPANALFTVSFMALPKPATSAPNDIKLDKAVTPKTVVATEVAEPIKTEPKAATSITAKIIDLSDDVTATIPKETTWKVANEPEQDTYRVFNGKYTIELPHINNAQLHVIANDSTKNSILFTYKRQNTKYVFNIKFANGHYLLTTYEIKSGKLVKVIDYNFVSSTKISDLIRNWLNL